MLELGVLACVDLVQPCSASPVAVLTWYTIQCTVQEIASAAWLHVLLPVSMAQNSCTNKFPAMLQAVSYCCFTESDIIADNVATYVLLSARVCDSPADTAFMLSGKNTSVGFCTMQTHNIYVLLATQPDGPLV